MAGSPFWAVAPGLFHWNVAQSRKPATLTYLVVRNGLLVEMESSRGWRSWNSEYPASVQPTNLSQMSDALFVYTDYHPEHTFTLKKRVLIRLIGKGRGVGWE